MRDILHEETAEILDKASASKKFYIFKILSIVFYIVSLLYFLLFTMSLPVDKIGFYLFGLLPNAIFCAMGYLFGKLRDDSYVEYDYIFISGDVKINKVIKSIKRRKGVNFTCREIEKIGIYASNTYNKIEKMPNVKKYYMTSNNVSANNKNFYYVLLKRFETKMLIVMECSVVFVKYLMMYTNSVFYDEEIKKI